MRNDTNALPEGTLAVWLNNGVYRDVEDTPDVGTRGRLTNVPQPSMFQGRPPSDRWYFQPIDEIGRDAGLISYYVELDQVATFSSEWTPAVDALTDLLEAAYSAQNAPRRIGSEPGVPIHYDAFATPLEGLYGALGAAMESLRRHADAGAREKGGR